MPTKQVPYTDAKGVRHWIEVEAGAARELDQFDRVMRYHERLYKQHVRLKTDVKAKRRVRPRKTRSAGRLKGYLNVELENAFRVMNRVDAGNPWEGPRYTFRHLLGESPTWPGAGCAIDLETQRVCRWTGEAWVCAFCGGAKLAAHQVCLGCDRTGRE